MVAYLIFFAKLVTLEHVTKLTLTVFLVAILIARRELETETYSVHVGAARLTSRLASLAQHVISTVSVLLPSAIKWGRFG